MYLLLGFKISRDIFLFSYILRNIDETVIMYIRVIDKAIQIWVMEV